MLMIAQPKTASTSLMYAIKNITNINVTQRVGLPYEKHPDWSLLTHSDMRIIPEKILTKWVFNKNKFYKQHLIPILEHEKTLNKTKSKFVVLFRDPKETLDSYKRLNKNSKIHSVIEYNSKAVMDEIDKWHRLALERFRGNNFLHMWFYELINNTFESVNLILEFYEFNQRVDRSFRLPKIRYSYRKS